MKDNEELIWGIMWLLPAFLQPVVPDCLWVLRLWVFLNRMVWGILLSRIGLQDIRERKISRGSSGLLILLGIMGTEGRTVVPSFSVQAFLPALLVLAASIPLGFRGVGGGDLFLVLAGGVLLGPTKGMQALLLGCMLALPEAMTQHVTGRIRQGGDRYIAWGPYLSLGIWLIFLAG